MHVAQAITDEQLHLLMDTVKVGDAVSRDPEAGDMQFNCKTVYYILCKSLCPTIGANSNGKVLSVLRNTLHALACSTTFDVEDLCLCEYWWIRLKYR